MDPFETDLAKSLAVRRPNEYIELYHRHPEAKAADQNGNPAGSDTAGLLGRLRLRSEKLTRIGKGYVTLKVQHNVRHHPPRSLTSRTISKEFFAFRKTKVCLVDIHNGLESRTILQVVLKSLWIGQTFFHPDENDRRIDVPVTNERFDYIPIDIPCKRSRTKLGVFSGD